MQHRSPLMYFLLITFFLISVSPVYAENGDANKLPVSEPQTLGKAAVLIDGTSGRVLYEVNAHQHLPPASVTKIMTGLLVVEKGNLNQKVTVSQTAADTPECSIWLEAGEKLTREQLLYACMLNSANDAAMELAESIAGSEQAFVKLMNQRARQLGLKDTHFSNPHGLEASGHYTTAYDLAMLSREALHHPVFRKVVSTQTMNIPWAGHEYNRLLINQNRLLYRYDGAIGVKTGYTKQAGNCVVGAAQRGDMVLIAVSLNSPSVYQDLEQMLDYGFNNYSKKTIKQAGQLAVTVPVENGTAESVQARPQTDLVTALTAKEQSQVSYKFYPEENVSAPVKKGQILGNCRIFVAGREAGRVNLVAGSSVNPQPPLWNRLKSTFIKIITFIFKTFLVLFGCAYLIRFINLRRQRRRRVYRA
jgi:D-alanyl-D-alanine carboxypeptidase (penicillin-binding protein 5/6)